MNARIEQANDQWASTRINALAASLEVPDRPSDLNRLTHYSPERSTSGSRSVLVAVGVGFVVIALLGAVVLIVAGHQSASSVNTVGDGQSGATTTTLSFEERAANLTKPFYPEDLRQSLYQAQLAWSDCMHAHGVDSFPTPNPSFGDGKTTPMILEQPAGGTPEGDTFMAAYTTCKPQADAVGHVSDEIHRRGF